MPRTVLILISFLIASCTVVAEEQPEPTLEEMAGQMLIIGFRGMEVSETDWIAQDIEKRNIGGVILFDYDVPTSTPARNIKSPKQLKALITQLKSYTDIPLIVSIDQEGGRVNRLKERFGFPKTVSHQYLGNIDNTDSTRYFATTMAKTLSDLGVNVNFAPVIDVNINTDNPVIGKLERSFSSKSAAVIRHASILIDEHRNNGVIASVKHFPGHGSAWNDSHYGMADVSETWQETELDPYRYFIQNNKVEMIMSAHIFNENWDTEHPATLSKKVMTTMLREELGFTGVLVSDDMQMGAVADYYGLEQAIVLAINAGVDILVFANNSVYDTEITSKAIDIILKNVENGTIPQSRIEEAYERIIKLKKTLSL